MYLLLMHAKVVQILAKHYLHACRESKYFTWNIQSPFLNSYPLASFIIINIYLHKAKQSWLLDSHFKVFKKYVGGKSFYH